MNKNYFFPPLSRLQTDHFQSSSLSLSPELQRTKVINAPNFSPQFRHYDQKGSFYTNPRSEYESRHQLLKQAYKEELKKAFEKKVKQIEQAKNNKRASLMIVKENILQHKIQSPPQYYSPEPVVKTQKSYPWLFESNDRVDENEIKKSQWIKAVDEQISQNIRKKQEIIMEKARKEKVDEERIRKELLELETAYKQEIFVEAKNEKAEITDSSINGLSVISKPTNIKSQIVNQPKNPPRNIFFEENTSEVLLLDEKQALNSKRAQVTELIRNLKFEAKASKSEEPKLFQDSSPQYISTNHLPRVGKTIFSNQARFQLSNYPTPLIYSNQYLA